MNLQASAELSHALPQRTWLLLVLLATTACPDTRLHSPRAAGLDGVVGNLERFEESRFLMGTLVRVVLYAPAEPQARAAFDSSFLRVEQLDRMLSDYKPESELSRLGTNAVHQPVAVSPELFFLLEQSLQISRDSHGAFDVSVGPLTQLWRQSRRTRRLPDAAVLAQAKEASGYRKIVLDRKSHAVRLLRSDMRLDLGGIAKGFAADEVLSTLRHRQISRALVAVGGDIAVSEAPPGAAGWVVSVRNADPTDPAPERKFVLINRAVSTSGDTEQFVEIGGQRYSHIIDPLTGLGLRNSSSVTVIAPSGTTADGLATALTVLPPPEALRLAERTPHVAALIVRRNGSRTESFVSRRMRRYL
ncbi:MAG: FAD:protein FMN transferase [Acidobacteriota bacterium]